MSRRNEVEVSVLLGATLTEVEQTGNDVLTFRTSDGKEYAMYHRQDCCESVSIEDVCGNLEDLVGSPLLMAEEASNSTDPPPSSEAYVDDSYTWTFYRFATIKGSVTIRWYGSSNGYYSESVSFVEQTS